MATHKSKQPTKVLEHGNIYFAYRPKVEKEEAKELRDVQRAYMILEPEGKRQEFRLFVLGQKKLPRIKGGGDKFWGFVEKIAHNPDEIQEELGGETYATKTRGEREQPPARPAGEGVYEIVRHGDHVHLAYALELPDKPGEVQKALNIEEEGSYIISVKNPDQPSPHGASLIGRQKADYPKSIQQKFHGRRFLDAEPKMLDYEGVEVLLIGARTDPEKELGIRLDTESETADTAEIFNHLRLQRSQHTVQPLLKGQWQ